jgi:hypothetical protein
MSGALRRELRRGFFWISAGHQCLAGLGVSGGGEGLASHLGQGSYVSVFGASLRIGPFRSNGSRHEAQTTQHAHVNVKVYPIHAISNSHRHNSLS